MKIAMKAEELKAAINALSTVANECRMHFDEDGMRVALVDYAAVLMVTMQIPVKDFIEFEEGPELCVDVTELQDKLSIAKKDDIVHIESTSDSITLRYANMEFKLPSLASATVPPEPGIPPIVNNSVFEAPMGFLRDGIKAAGKIGSFVSLISKDRAFVMESSEDGSRFRITESENITIHQDDDAKSMFSTDLIELIIKGLGKSTSATVEIGTDTPLIIKGKIGEAGTLKYLLAPRIEAD